MEKYHQHLRILEMDSLELRRFIIYLQTDFWVNRC